MINSLILDPVSVFLTVIIIQNSITTVASWAQAIVVLCIGFCTVVLALFCPLPCASLVEMAASEEVIWEYEEKGKYYPMTTYYSSLMEGGCNTDFGAVLKYDVPYGKNKSKMYHYEVNFSDLTQRNIDTGTVKKVRRGLRDKVVPEASETMISQLLIEPPRLHVSDRGVFEYCVGCFANLGCVMRWPRGKHSEDAH